MIRAADLLVLLREEQEKRPGMADSLDLYAALIALAASHRRLVPPDWPERARARLACGEAALSFDEVEPECGRCGRLAQEICRIAAGQRPDLAVPLSRVATRLATASRGEMRSIIAAHLENKSVAAEVEPALLQFAMSHALYPILHAYAIATAPVLQELHWPRGTCPVCDSYPDLAAIEPGVGARRLLCGRCDSEWSYRRIGCPFCDNEDPTALGYFTVSDAAHRLYVCDRCKGYLKTIDRRQLRRVRPLPLERLLTVGMDVPPARQTYQRA